MNNKRDNVNFKRFFWVPKIIHKYLDTKNNYYFGLTNEFGSVALSRWKMSCGVSNRGIRSTTLLSKF